MLKKFFLNFLSSFTATWLALGLFGVVAAIVVVSLFSKMNFSAGEMQTEKLDKHSVMVIDLEGRIEEREMIEDFNLISLAQGDAKSQLTLQGLLNSIREAKENKKIEMIYLKCGNMSASPATLDALRKGLEDFKSSKKQIYAYGDNYSLGTYYLATVADSLFVNSYGSIALKGVSGTTPYMKGLFDKLGIQFQVVKVGTFKSAVEPYVSETMSAPARAQLDTLYGNIWRDFSSSMEKSRKLKEGTLDRLIDSEFLMLQDGEFAVKQGLADAAVYERTIDARVADAIGVDKKKLNYVSSAFVEANSEWGSEWGTEYMRPHVAILYAVGEIMEGNKSGIDCEVMVPEIIRLADDDNVKGMVMRVNSPGGSVFGSEQIGEALSYFKSKGKPFAVSMGDYAASGGYWISCDADKIFADRLTITGSIGIFGLIPNAAGLAEKAGVSFQTVATNPEADFPSLFRPLTPIQMDGMQKFIDQGYDQFITRVAKGRKMKKSEVEKIAEGRVWDGQTAKKIGLVDELGGLQDAVDYVWDKAGSNGGRNSGVAAYPQLTPTFWDIVRKNAQREMKGMMTQQIMEMIPEGEYAMEAVKVLKRKAVQARSVVKIEL